MSFPLKHLLIGTMWREEVYKLIPASNGPHIVYLLRQMKFEIHCERVRVINRKGNVCYSDRYSLTPEDRQKAIQFLESKEQVVSQ